MLRREVAPGEHTMAARPDLLFVGIRGRVVALERSTGDIVWTTVLVSGSTLVPLVVDDRHLFAISGGEVTCLDPSTGEVLWHNGLKGYGTGYATFAQDLPPVVSAAAAAQQAAAAAASTTTFS